MYGVRCTVYGLPLYYYYLKGRQQQASVVCLIRCKQKEIPRKIKWIKMRRWTWKLRNVIKPKTRTCTHARTHMHTCCWTMAKTKKLAYYVFELTASRCYYHITMIIFLRMKSIQQHTRPGCKGYKEYNVRSTLNPSNLYKLWNLFNFN